MGDKQFNYRLLFGLIASLAVFATVVHLVHAYQVQRHALTLKEQAQRAEEAGQTEQVALLLKRYLLLAPNDTAALLHYSATLEKLPPQPANRWLAVAALRQVLAPSPNRRDVREHLIALLMELKAYPEAREQLEILLTATPKDARVEALLGRCLEEDGHLELALETYEKAIAHDPAQIDCYTRLAALRFNRFSQSEAADAVMDAAIKANDGNFKAYLARCLYRMGRGRLDDAAKDLTQAKTRAPSDARVLVTAAELAYRRGRIDEARAAWNEGLKQHPDTLNMYLGLATLEIANQRPKEAIACLRLGLAKYPGQTDLLHLLTETYLQQEDVESAEEIVVDLRHDSATTGIAEYLHARILLHRGQWSEVIPLLEKTLATQDLPNPLASRIYVSLAQCYEHLSDTDRCLAAYQQAAALEPSLVPAHLGLATALLAAGKSDEALSQLRVLSQLPQAPEDVWLPLGRALLQQQLALPPHKRRWDELESALQHASTSDKRIVPTALLRADVLLGQGKPDEAAKTLEQTRDKFPDKPALWTALANLTAQRGNRAGAERILAEARKQLGDRFELRLAALGLGIGLDGPQAQTTLLQHEKDIQHFTPEEQWRLLATLADLHYRLGQTSEGDRLTHELAARQPLDLPAALIILELALQSRDEALSVQFVAELRRLEGEEGTWWRYAEARRQLNRMVRGGPPAANEARRLLAEIAKRRPDWSRAALLEATLCEINGDAAGAIKAYTKAFEHGERQQGMVYRLMVLLVAQDRAVEADEVMSRAQQQLVPRGSLARFAAETALRVRQHDRAVTLAQLAVAADSRDPQQFIWLGHLLAAAKRPADAEEALRHAVAIRDNIRDTWEALIAFYAQEDREKEAEDALQTMQSKLRPAQLPLALAWCEEALGRLKQAEQHYLEAQKNQPSDGLTQQRLAAFYVRLQQTAKAEAALRGLLDPTLRFPPQTTAETVAWARRQLALLQAENGGDAGYREALALLELNKGQSIADVRAAAFVKATRGDKERAEAVRVIEETLKDQPLSADEQFRLTKLYEAENDWGNARDHLVALLEKDRRNPEYVAYFIAALLERNRREEARTWLAKLEKLEPESARVTKFQALLK
jgi:cellulose synthase operon protein C